MSIQDDCAFKKLTFLDSINVIKIYPPLMASFFYHASK